MPEQKRYATNPEKHRAIARISSRRPVVASKRSLAPWVIRLPPSAPFFRRSSPLRFYLRNRCALIGYRIVQLANPQLRVRSA